MLDPDITLASLRVICRSPELGDLAEARRVLELFQALDDHLSRGGALPRAWRPPAR